MFFTHLSLLYWLLPLLALPALIHLLNRKFPRLFRFPSIENIRKTMAQRSRLFRWRHLLLALLRTLAIACLLLAFLKPVREMFGSNQVKKGARNVVILFDHSLSMEYNDGSLSGRERGWMEAEKIIDSLGANDLLNVVAVGRTPEAAFLQSGTDHRSALAFLKALEPGLGEADFNQANTFAGLALAKAGASAEVYYISDFQRRDWGEVIFPQIPTAARLFFVNIGQEERENRAILSAELKTSGDPHVEVRVGNFGAAPFNGSIEAILDQKRSSKADVSIAPWAESTVTLAISDSEAGLHTLEVRLAGDALPQDDVRFVSWQSASGEEVLVVSDDTGGKMQQSGFFITKALNPFSKPDATIRPRSLSSAALSGANLATTKKAFMTHLDLLNPDKAKILGKFLTDGGSIIWFLDGQADSANLALLDATAGGNVVPLKLTTRQTPENLSGGAQQILKGDFQSKYLRLFTGTRRQNLALLEFYEFYQALPTGSGKVILNYADGTPAMAVGSVGTGTLVLCNFSVNELASNVARQRLFPAWIQDLVKTLDLDEDAEKPLEIGDRVEKEIWTPDLAEASVISPGGKAVRTERELTGDHYLLGFTTEEPGFYRINEGEIPLAFAVNVPAAQSDLRSVDLGILPQRSGENGKRTHFVHSREEFQFLTSGRPFFQWFVFGALLFLLLEIAALALFKRLAR